jgi:hypothetical protein
VDYPRLQDVKKVRCNIYDVVAGLVPAIHVFLRAKK